MNIEFESVMDFVENQVPEKQKTNLIESLVRYKDIELLKKKYVTGKRIVVTYSYHGHPNFINAHTYYNKENLYKLVCKFYRAKIYQHVLKEKETQL